MSEQLKTIIWDLDGTLIDSFEISLGLYKEILPLHGRPAPTREFLLQNYHGSLHETVGTLLDLPSDTDQVEAVVQDFLLAQNAHYENMEGHVFNDALDLAKRAHEQNIRQIIVTNRFHEGRGNASPRSVVARTALKPYIDQIICGDDTAFRKPDGKVLGSLQYDPETTLVIGDQPVDVELARNIGAQAIIVWRSDEPHVHTERLNLYTNFQVIFSLKDIRVSNNR